MDFSTTRGVSVDRSSLQVGEASTRAGMEGTAGTRSTCRTRGIHACRDGGFDAIQRIQEILRHPRVQGWRDQKNHQAPTRCGDEGVLEIG